MDHDLLGRMTDSLAHRGPDGRGLWTAPGVGLGHRRLAVIDLAGGAQPMHGDDPRVVASVNGEIYNYRAAQANFPGRWRTRSDTEVFIRAYETSGLAGFRPLVGMWGAAIWDGRTERLVIVRDRLGIKPVYYAPLDDGGIAAASELRALLLHPKVAPRLDRTALDQLLTFRFVPWPRTPFEAIKKLPPGHAMTIDARGRRVERWWNPRPEARPWTDRDAEDAFLAGFDEAVRARLVSDVPVGLFLSGGVDSSALLDAAARPLPCFTARFEGETRHDESALAQRTAARMGAEHRIVSLGPEDYEATLCRYVEMLEEPVLNDSALATAALSRAARAEVKVVLSGQGADEPLGGYDRMKGEFLARPFQRLRAGRLRPVVEALRLPEKFQRAFRSLSVEDPLARALRIYAVVQDEEKAALWRPEARPTSDVAEPLRRLHREVVHLTPLGRMLYCDTRLWLVDDLLLVADKLSMAYGLELRVPYLDHRLIELLETMPDSQKIRLTGTGIETKSVHRRAMRRRISQDILQRPKRGFNNPMDRWLRSDLLPLAARQLLQADGPLAALFQLRTVRTMLDAHAAGARDHRRVLFLLLTLDAWMRAFRVLP